MSGSFNNKMITYFEQIYITRNVFQCSCAVKSKAFCCLLSFYFKNTFNRIRLPTKGLRNYASLTNSFYVTSILVLAMTDTLTDSDPTLDRTVSSERICFLFFFSFSSLLWPPCVADADIIFLPCGFFFFLLLFSSPTLSLWLLHF